MKISEWMFWNTVNTQNFNVIVRSNNLIRADKDNKPFKQSLFFWKDNERTEHVYYTNNIRHRENGPAHYVYVQGNLVCLMYVLNGELHREDGPAIEKFDKDGNVYRKTYFNHGQKIVK